MDHLTAEDLTDCIRGKVDAERRDGRIRHHVRTRRPGDAPPLRQSLFSGPALTFFLPRQPAGRRRPAQCARARRRPPVRRVRSSRAPPSGDDPGGGDPEPEVGPGTLADGPRVAA